MLEAIGRLAITRSRHVLAVAVLFTIIAAVLGIPVSRSLSTGGFQDPSAESSSASRMLADNFDAADMRLILAVHADGGVDSPAAATAGGRLVAMLEKATYVTTVTSAWTVPAAAAKSLISEDGKTGLIVAGIGGDDTDAQQHARQLAENLPHVDGVTVKAGGEAMSNVQMVDQSRKDMAVLEMIAVPLSLIILLWVFGGVVAAALPVAVGLFAILGSMAVLRLVTMVTEVSVFALDLVSALGLALAIDYTLLIVSRFRDEIAAGAQPGDALIRTMTTAGRTVLFSATTVALSMVAMVMFPMPFLKSLAYAGVAVV
ncbi:MAG TPA: MMPL family transporter, partial [Mycobacterium sp.]|nr:MMPL family transporter [Mycobacterium sp.]